MQLDAINLLKAHILIHLHPPPLLSLVTAASVLFSCQEGNPLPAHAEKEFLWRYPYDTSINYARQDRFSIVVLVAVRTIKGSTCQNVQFVWILCM